MLLESITMERIGALVKFRMRSEVDVLQPLPCNKETLDSCLIILHLFTRLRLNKSDFHSPNIDTKSR